MDGEHIEVIVAKAPDPEREWPRKELMLDPVPIWRDRDMNTKIILYENEPNLRWLMWTVLTFGSESWTLTKAEEKKGSNQLVLWIYRRMLRVS